MTSPQPHGSSPPPHHHPRTKRKKIRSKDTFNNLATHQPPPSPTFLSPPTYPLIYKPSTQLPTTNPPHPHIPPSNTHMTSLKAPLDNNYHPSLQFKTPPPKHNLTTIFTHLNYKTANTQRTKKVFFPKDIKVTHTHTQTNQPTNQPTIPNPHTQTDRTQPRAIVTDTKPIPYKHPIPPTPSLFSHVELFPMSTHTPPCPCPCPTNQPQNRYAAPTNLYICKCVQYGGETGTRKKGGQKQGKGKNRNSESQKKHQRAIFLKTSEEVPCNSVKSTKTRGKSSKIKSRKGKAAKGNNHPGSPPPPGRISKALQQNHLKPMCRP